MGRTTKRETENKRAIGLDNPSPGSVSLGEMGGLGRNAMDALVGKAAEYAKPKKRDGSKRKRGGQGATRQSWKPQKQRSSSDIPIPTGRIQMR